MRTAETVLNMSLESHVMSKESCVVWGGAVGKVPNDHKSQRNSLAAYHSPGGIRWSGIHEVMPN